MPCIGETFLLPHEMVVIKLLSPCYLSPGIQRWQGWQRSQRRPGNLLFQIFSWTCTCNSDSKKVEWYGARKPGGIFLGGQEWRGKAVILPDGRAVGQPPCPSVTSRSAQWELVSQRGLSLEVSSVSPDLHHPEPEQFAKVLLPDGMIMLWWGLVRFVVWDFF